MTGAEPMRAVRVQDYGGSDRLRLDRVARPVPQDGQVLVRVLACGVNPLDAWFRSGHLAARFARPLPYVPGSDVAGEIVAVGPHVPGALVGRRVLALLDYLSDGGYADHAVTEAGRTAPLPDGLDPVRAAALPTPALTGVQMIDRVREGPGPVRAVLVLGALGAVGRAAVFEAVRQGLRVTAAVRAERADEARALGVAAAVDAVPPAAGPASNGDRFDAVVDTVGPEVAGPWLPWLRRGGTMLSVVPLAPPAGAGDDVTVAHMTVRPDMERLEHLARRAAAGELTTPPLVRLPLEEAARAHGRLLAGRAGGKFVVVP